MAKTAVVETPIQVEALRETPQQASQPAFQPEPKLEERQVRAAMQAAAQNGLDPFKITVGDMESGLEGIQRKAQAEMPVDVPEKFKKPNGEVDVEKLKTSTERLDEAIQQKQEAIKTVDDYVREYKAKESQMRNMPNPERIMAQLPPVQQQPPLVPQQMDDAQLEAIINADIAKNPAKVMAEFVRLQLAKEREGLQKELAPILEERKDNTIRDNIRQIAERDPRILNQQVFDAVNVKLQQSPELWNLKNPHKAAWLEVKEEMRLGELPQGTPAQPSRPTAPILGGGTPPPAPSLQETRTSFETLNAAIGQMSHDPRSGKVASDQQRALDQAAKQFFDEQERFRR